MEEKRKYIRVKAPIVVSYKVSGKSPASKKSIAKNFSEGGIRLTVYEKLQVGSTLELRIDTPFDTIPIVALGEVVWSKPLSLKEGREVYDLVLKFTKMENFDKKKMAQATRGFLSMGMRYRAG